MTLEGEYYFEDTTQHGNMPVVAILMTLEGEYYGMCGATPYITPSSRNPHDIGRRILQKKIKMENFYDLRRNPHDIGRRILQEEKVRAI